MFLSHAYSRTKFISHTFEFISHDHDHGSNFIVMWQADHGESIALEQVNEQQFSN
jgi:hypothetical protein